MLLPQKQNHISTYENVLHKKTCFLCLTPWNGLSHNNSRIELRSNRLQTFHWTVERLIRKLQPFILKSIEWFMRTEKEHILNWSMSQTKVKTNDPMPTQEDQNTRNEKKPKPYKKKLCTSWSFTKDTDRKKQHSNTYGIKNYSKVPKI